MKKIRIRILQKQRFALWVCFLFFFISCEMVFSSVPENRNYFDEAINEIEAMLTGKDSLSFKRAVFLVENAFFDGQLSWEEFDGEIRRIVPILRQMIVDKGLQQYKTCGNWAIFSFMCDTIPENGFRPYRYDFESLFDREDPAEGKVSKLLKTGIGNCHSLPILYKILADELGAEALLAIVPMHVYVKHRDENGNWWNLELTTGSFSRSSFLMEAFNVSEAAVQSGLFMKGLSDVESVAMCITDMLSYYDRKTGSISDEFVRKCLAVGLKYYPVSYLQLYRIYDMQYRLEEAMLPYGIPTRQYHLLAGYPHLEAMHTEWLEAIAYLEELGYSRLSLEKYTENMNEARKLRERANQ
ncbi:MAG: hypothetical protein LUG18_16205 [Candidatus Azobacteroides sp.]|nr:hypothetical protein [Candidatus Azobacteroides sp.]